MFQLPLPEEPSVRSCGVFQCLLGIWQHMGQGSRVGSPQPHKSQEPREGKVTELLGIRSCPRLSPLTFCSDDAESPLMALSVSSPGLYHCLPSQLCPSFCHSPHPKGRCPWAALAFCWAGWAAQRLRGTKARQRKGRGLATAFVAGTRASSPEPVWLVFRQAEIQAIE